MPPTLASGALMHHQKHNMPINSWEHWFHLCLFLVVWFWPWLAFLQYWRHKKSPSRCNMFDDCHSNYYLVVASLWRHIYQKWRKFYIVRCRLIARTSHWYFQNASVYETSLMATLRGTMGYDPQKWTRTRCRKTEAFRLNDIIAYSYVWQLLFSPCFNNNSINKRESIHLSTFGSSGETDPSYKYILEYNTWHYLVMACFVH